MLRPQRIRQYLRLMSEKGFSEAQVLEGSQIDHERLRESSYLIEEWQCRTVIHRMLALSGDDGLGFEVGQRCQLQDLGVAGCAAMTSPTMRQAMILWESYARSLVGVLSQLKVGKTSGGLTLRVTEPPPDDALCRFCTEELLTLIHTLGSELAGRPPVFERLSLAYAAPAHADRYATLFRCPIEFGGGSTMVTLNKAWLDEPRPGGEAAFNTLCVHYFGQAVEQIGAQQPFSAQLRALFSETPDHPPKPEAAAKRLGLSTRTMRRYLSCEGTSYRKLVDEFRSQLATDYLISQRRKPKEVAYLLGFSNQSAFGRAFKQWTGLTTREVAPRPRPAAEHSPP